MAEKKETKKVVKKAPAKKKVAKKEPKIEMVSYSIKMTIPTGQYANIIPEIVVKAGTPDEAHQYIAPHMNKLWKEYFMISERKTEVVKPVAKVETPVAPTPTAEPVNTPAPAEASPVSDVALVKATQAIESCLSTEALDLIIKQIGVSTKLTDENKQSLLPIVEAKSKKLNGEA